MTREEKIAGAAEIIVSEYKRIGNVIALPDAVALATKLYQFWSERVQSPNLKAGDVARHFRERYSDWPLIDGPLVIKEITDVGPAADGPSRSSPDRGADA